MSRKLLFSTLSVTIAISGLFGAARADEVVQQTETTTQNPSEARVTDSWMQPTVTQVKKVTDADGNVKEDRAPIVMERHERVEQPITDTQTTTLIKNTPVVKQVVQSSNTAVKKSTYVSHKPYHHKYVAHHVVRKQAVATEQQTVSAPVQEIRQEQRVTQRSVIMDRPDPALNQP